MEGGVGGEGRGGALDMGSAPLPLETSSGSAPVSQTTLVESCGYVPFTAVHTNAMAITQQSTRAV